MFGVKCPDGLTSSEFTAHVLRNCGVVTTPGNGFGPSGEGYIRFALTVPEDRLKEALERIEKAGLLSQKARAFIGAGANLGEPVRQIRQAQDERWRKARG